MWPKLQVYHSLSLILLVSSCPLFLSQCHTAITSIIPIVTTITIIIIVIIVVIIVIITIIVVIVVIITIIVIIVVIIYDDLLTLWRYIMSDVVAVDA